MNKNNFDLCKIIKGYKGETFFCVIFGEVAFIQIKYKSEYPIMIRDISGTDFYLDREGRSLANFGYTVLFPDKESFEKYPLNPEEAWEEWQKSHKPQIWRAEVNQNFFWIDLTEDSEYINSESEKNLPDHNKLYKIGNYFHSAEAAKEAKKMIEKALESFHEANDPKPENSPEVNE